MLTLVVHEKGGRTQRVPVQSDPFAIGRDDDNDLVLDRVNVSKHHLRLRRHDGHVEVMDLQSTNGTYVNGRRVQEPRPVRRSDRIYVGDYILVLEGDDQAIAPLRHGELRSEEGRRPVTLPPAGLTVPAEDGDLMTSAPRVAGAGFQSSYLDRVANRVLQAVLLNVHRLDPVKAEKIRDEDRQETLTLVTAMLADMQGRGELEEGVDVESLTGKIARELLDLGPLAELMKDDEIGEIQIVGGDAIRVVRQRGDGQARVELTERRFSGDRALVLTIQRLARRWGFLVEGAQILEGKVDDGFAMYALLPPSQARNPVLSLRRNRTDASTLEALVHEGVLSGPMREMLVAALQGNRRVLVCASGAVNLDRFMQATVGEIPENRRVLCISDTGQLGAGRGGWVRVRRMGDPTDGVVLSDALGVLLRGGVDLLVSQRCRHEDAAAVMDAMAGATRGALVSLWGIDSAHALWRLAGLSTVAAGAISALTVSLARSVDLLLRLGPGVGGEPMQIVEVVEPRVREGNEIVHVPVFRAMRGSDGTTTFQPTGTVPGFVQELGAQGIVIPASVFRA